MFPITHDAAILGVLFGIMWFVFHTSKSELPFFKWTYKIVPPLIWCYFLPAFALFFGLVDVSNSNLYYVASRFFLPASLFLFCVSIDLPAIRKLGFKTIIMFFTATFGVIIGAPLAILFLKWISPSLLPENIDSLWRGLSTIAGSWIGGSANQTAMKEIYNVSEQTFSVMIIVDVFVQNFLLTFLLYGSAKPEKFNKWLKADTSSIDNLINKLKDFQNKTAKIPTFDDLIKLFGLTFLVVGLAHLLKSLIAPSLKNYLSAELAVNPDSWLQYITTIGNNFFWLVVLVTIFGVVASMTKARNLEGVGASKFASLFLYILIGTLGLQMDIRALLEDWAVFKFYLPVAFLWLIIHVVVIFLVAKLIRAPFFFLAVASQANLGGAASAPVVASAYDPRLAPVGVLLAVLGYAVGTFGAILCTFLMATVV